MAADIALALFPQKRNEKSVALFPEAISENCCVAQTLVGPDWRDT